MARPLAVHRPRSEEEVRILVRRAAARGERVRVVGAGHSCAAVADADGAHLVSLERLCRPLAIDDARKRVTVEAGMTLATLNRLLALHGLALPSLGSISVQTVAGLISTGTHGSGLAHGSIAENVVGLRLLTADGDIIEITDETPDLLHAARVSLGLFGVILAVTFACCDAFTLELITRPVSLGAALDDFATLSSVDHFGFWWFPHIDRLALRSFRRCEQPPTAPPGAIRSWWINHAVAGHLYGARLLAAADSPSRTARANGWLFDRLFPAPARQVGPSHEMFGVTPHLRHSVIEYGVPLERSREAITRLQALLRRGDHLCHAPIDVRFTAPDASWLSPAYRRATCWIGPMIYRPFGRALRWEPLFRDIDALFADLGGRPHWAKIHYRSATDLAALYPRWADFRAIRQRLDPNGIFLNDYLAGLFG